MRRNSRKYSAGTPRKKSAANRKESRKNRNQSNKTVECNTKTAYLAPKVVVENMGRDKPANAEQGAAALRMVEYVLDRGYDGLLREYNERIKVHRPPVTRVGFDANMDKNRYKDIICGDETRVLLDVSDGLGGDYIHANHVRGPPLLNNFICTQGPLDGTVLDFYRMLVQQNVGLIFMLCETREMGKEKCAQYWPREVNASIQFGPFTVLNQGKDDSRDERTACSNLLITYNGSHHQVKHFLWLNWPDRGVPESVRCPLRLLRIARQDPRPTVVHCSAGIGRTGSVVAIEYIIQSMLTLQPFNLMECVMKVREHRALSVQTDVQYVYIARVICQYAFLCGPNRGSWRDRVDHFEKECVAKMRDRNQDDVYAPVGRKL